MSSTELLDSLKRLVDSLGDARSILVAFSGGPDSTALLWGLAQIAEPTNLRLHAAHLDHCLDADSRRRADAARALASRLGVPIVVERLRESTLEAESTEAFARRHRYTFLFRVADELGIPWIATAHHTDDQAETVLLRLLFGSGLEGLGAMRPIRGRVVRPLLSCRRAALDAALEATNLQPVEDPTNFDLGVPRNAVRRRLLPHLERRDPGMTERLIRLAEKTQHVSQIVERHFDTTLDLETLTTVIGDRPRGVAIGRQALEELPSSLLPMALAWLHRKAGAPYPAASAARRELLRQIHTGAGIGCDCGHGWRWEADNSSFRLVRGASSPGRIAYNLTVPGSVDISEFSLRVRLTRGKVASWMYSGSVHRTGLANLSLEASSIVVRNRRPGDRIQPLGSGKQRRLKDLLIDRRIPRQERDRLPLLVIDGEIAWVPGVTIGDRFKLDGGSSAWIAEIEDLRAPSDKSAFAPHDLVGDSSKER